MPGVFEWLRGVRQDEIDALGHAHNVAYVQWLVEAAVAHSAAQGWPVERHLELGSGWVVRRHVIEYRQPARPDDLVRIVTWVSGFSRTTSTRQYRLLRAADAGLLAAAETQWAYVDFTSGRPLRIPAAVAAAFEVVAGDPLEKPA